MYVPRIVDCNDGLSSGMYSASRSVKKKDHQESSLLGTAQLYILSFGFPVVALLTVQESSLREHAPVALVTVRRRASTSLEALAFLCRVLFRI